MIIALSIYMKTKPKDSIPPECYQPAFKCPKCGRWLYDQKVGNWKEGFEHYNMINWNHKGGHFYLSNGTHSPRFCWKTYSEKPIKANRVKD
jgi:hypothetical protein